MFGTSGIRGRVGETVSAQLGVDLGNALAAWGAERVVIGRDTRPSGSYLAEAVTSGLRQGGVDVVDLGVSATPTVARSVQWQEADAGVVITASHNPPEDNGFKLWLPSGQAFRPADQADIETNLDSNQIVAYHRAELIGTYEQWPVADDWHVDALCKSVEITQPHHVVIDIGNGTGQLTATALDALGCEVTTIHGQRDGSFPGRPSEPTPENCVALQQIVPAINADLGIAHDGDADRMRAVDEQGRFLPGDSLLSLFATAEASAGDAVVVPVDTSLAMVDLCEERDIEVIRTRVGDVYVADAVRTSEAVFGGEPSGAWIWPSETLCPDGPLAACKLVEFLEHCNEQLSTLADAIDSYPIRRESLEVDEKVSTMNRIGERLQSQYDQISTIDGLRVETGDGWFLIRPSGTEPLIRVTAEARNADRADVLLGEAFEIVSKSMVTQST